MSELPESVDRGPQVFPKAVDRHEFILRCKEWELAGYTVVKADEDIPYRRHTPVVRIFEPLRDYSVFSATGYGPKEGVDYYWLVKAYMSVYTEFPAVYSELEVPHSQRIVGASSLGIVL